MKKEIKNSSLNVLGNELIEIIKSRTNIFEKIIIVTPNFKTQQWFKAYWLKNNNDILMNVEFLSINEALLSMINIGQNVLLMNNNQMQAIIMKILAENYEDFSEINKYYYDESTINANKLFDLSSEIVKLFNGYENDQTIISGWQEELYNRLIKNAEVINLSTLSYLYNSLGVVNRSKKLYFFGFSGLTALQDSIINEYSKNSDVNIYQLERDKSFTNDYQLIKAPSKLREVEAIHTKICKLLEKPENTLSDFLVYAPDISVYEGIINRVFNQDGEKYPNIPYSITKKKRIETAVSQGLKRLFKIINRGNYTRNDFVEIINNEDIIKTRKLETLDIYTFSKTIVDMNAYRNNNEKDDWKYVKKRLLSSKIVNINDIDQNILCLKEGSYLPFANISLDDNSIVRFVKLIDDLDYLCKVKNDIKYVDSSNVYIIREVLDKWFSIKDKNDFETNKCYLKAIGIINLFNQLNFKEESIPLEVLFLMMIKVTSEVNSGCKEIFTRGITFSDFDTDAILSSKYIFFLNASSTSLPKIVLKNEYDLREETVSNIEIEENAFNLLHQNASERFFISYVNIDLKTDEDLYPSSFIINLKKRNNQIDDEIHLDEKRDWNEIFTANEAQNKNYYNNLLKNIDSEDSPKDITYTANERLKLKIKDITKFIEEPLSSKANYLFGREDDLGIEIKDEYEPFEINAITNYNLTNKLLSELILSKETELSDEFLENFKRRINLEYKLPNITELINNVSFETVKENVHDIINYVEAVFGSDFDVMKHEDKKIDKYILINNISAVYTIIDKTNDDGKKYKELTCIELKKCKDNEDNRFLDLYFASLHLISDRDEEDYNVILLKGNKKERRFNITPEAAKKLLIKVCELMNDYSCNVYLPSALFKEEIKKYSDLTSNIMYGPWKYYDDINLFDFETKLGYSYSDFDKKDNKFNMKKREIIELVKYFPQEDKKEDDDDE